jgi:hypothetical protein
LEFREAAEEPRKPVAKEQPKQPAVDLDKGLDPKVLQKYELMMPSKLTSKPQRGIPEHFRKGGEI